MPFMRAPNCATGPRWRGLSNLHRSNAETAEASGRASRSAPPSRRGIRARQHGQRRPITTEHQHDVHPRPRRRTPELAPYRHAPQRRHHRRRLPNRIGNRHADKARRDEIEDRARSPDESPQDAEQVIPGARRPESTEINRLADERPSHEEPVDDEAGEKGPDREEYGNAVRPQWMT